MKTLTIFLSLLAVGCAKPAQEPVASPAGSCQTYVAPYMVEYPDASVRKSEVTACPGSLKASALDSSGETETAGSLTIRLMDSSGVQYFTAFSGQ